MTSSIVPICTKKVLMALAPIKTFPLGCSQAVQRSRKIKNSNYDFTSTVVKVINTSLGFRIKIQRF